MSREGYFYGFEVAYSRYHRLNIFYMLMEKLNSFAEGRYDTHVSTQQIQDDYENRRTDAWERIENMSITKRIVSTAKMLQASRHGADSLGRSNTTSTTSSSRTMPPVSRSVSGSSFTKKAPPPPPSFGSNHAPPPYTPPPSNSNFAAAAATKRAPPPPPPLKPKPKAEPPVQYVVALYDFAAQVRYRYCCYSLPFNLCQI